MNIAPQTLARQRIRELRKRQTAFNSHLNHVIHQLSLSTGPATDPIPGQWPALWVAWQAAHTILLAIASTLPPPPERR